MKSSMSTQYTNKSHTTSRQHDTKSVRQPSPPFKTKQIDNEITALANHRNVPPHPSPRISGPRHWLRKRQKPLRQPQRLYHRLRPLDQPNLNRVTVATALGYSGRHPRTTPSTALGGLRNINRGNSPPLQFFPPDRSRQVYPLHP